LLDGAAAVAVFDAGGAPAIEQHAFDVDAGAHFQIGAPHRVMKISAIGAVPASAALVDLVVSESVLRLSVIIGVSRIARRDGRRDERFGQDRPLGHTDNSHGTAAAAQIALAVLETFDLLEVGQNVVPAPADITELRPSVVIVRLATDENHPI